MKTSSGIREQCKMVAKAILHDRTQRRKMMLQYLMLVMVLISLGVWVLDDWLGGSPWIFIMYWLTVTCAVFMLVLFAVYDMLRTYQEIHHEEK